MDTSFEEAIKEHLQLREQNRRLAPELPLAGYRTGDPILVESDAGPAGWPSAEKLAPPDDLWVGPPAFDWGR